MKAKKKKKEKKAWGKLDWTVWIKKNIWIFGRHLQPCLQFRLFDAADSAGCCMAARRRTARFGNHKPATSSHLKVNRVGGLRQHWHWQLYSFMGILALTRIFTLHGIEPQTSVRIRDEDCCLQTDRSQLLPGKTNKKTNPTHSHSWWVINMSSCAAC